MRESKGYRPKENVLLKSNVLGPPYSGIRGLTPQTKRAPQESLIRISLSGSPRANALNETCF